MDKQVTFQNVYEVWSKMSPNFLKLSRNHFPQFHLILMMVFFSKDIGRSDAYILIRQQNSSAKRTTMVQPRELVDRTLNLDQSVYPLIE